MTRLVPEEALPLLTQVAREVARQFAGFVSLDDMQQEAFLWALSNPKKVREYLDDQEDPKRGTRMLYASARNRLRWVAVRERAARGGYSPADLAWYSVAQLEEELLPAVFDREKWASPPKTSDGEIRSVQDPAHGGNWMAMLADCADAWSKLDEPNRTIIAMKYRDDVKQRDIASHYEIAESSVSERIDRAVRKMHHLLGGDRPEYEEDEIRIGRRSVVSNAAAQAMVRTGYDGE